MQSSKNNCVRLGIFYRPPNSTDDLNKEINKEIELAVKDHGFHKSIIILGDFNYPNIDLSSMIGKDRNENFLT